MHRTLVERAWLAPVLAFAIAGGVCAWSLRRMEIDAGTNMLLNENDPDLHYYNRTRADWEYDEYTIVCITRDDWFTEAGILLLNQFTDALAAIPGVERVTAINTVPLLRNGRQDVFRLLRGEIASWDLRMPEVYRDPRRLEKAREEILGHTQALGNLVSADGRNLSVLVYLRVSDDVRRLEPEWNRLHGEEGTPEVRAQIGSIRPHYERAIRELREARTAHVRELRRTCREWEPRFSEPIRLSGLPIVNVNLVEHVDSDLRTFGVLAAAMFVLGFAVVFRKLRWTVLPLIACALPVVLVLGAMTLAGKRITVITSNMPVLLFVLMLPYTVYFIERWRELRSADPSLDSATSATRSARDIWLPCFYSAATTMGGTASLLTSGISPVRTFGLMMTIGIALGLAAVFLFLPAAVRPLRPLSVSAPRRRGPLHLLARIPLRAPRLVLLASAVILGLSVWGTSKLTVETKFIDYFHSRSEVYRGLEYIDTRMGGTTPLEVVLRSDQKRHLWCASCGRIPETQGEGKKRRCRSCGGAVTENPGFFETEQGFAALRAVEEYFRAVPETGNVRSFATLIAEIRKTVPAKDEVLARGISDHPKVRGLVREFCTPDFSTARVLIRMKETAPTLNRKRILDGLGLHLGGRLELSSLRERRPTGVFVLYSNMLQSLIRSQKDTFLIVLLAIFGMLVVLFRNPLLALLVLLPQVLPVFVVLGTMGFAGIPLDMVTTMIASMAMGVGIDPAIQYAVRYRRELRDAKTPEEAIERTHATIGRAIGIGGAIVFSGFSVLVLSKFVPTAYFGIFTGLAVLMGILASLTTLPSLFVLLRYPRN